MTDHPPPVVVFSCDPENIIPGVPGSPPTPAPDRGRASADPGASPACGEKVPPA